MEWYWAFSIIVGALCALMVIGMPIAFAFLAVNIAGAYFFWGGVAGLNQMVLAVMDWSRASPSCRCRCSC